MSENDHCFGAGMWTRQFAQMDKEDEEGVAKFLDQIQEETIRLQDDAFQRSVLMHSAEEGTEEYRKMQGEFMQASKSADDAEDAVMSIITMTFHLCYAIPEKSSIMLAMRMMDLLDEEDLSEMVQKYGGLYLSMYAAVRHEDPDDMAHFEETYAERLEEMEDELRSFTGPDLDRRLFQPADDTDQTRFS